MARSGSARHGPAGLGEARVPPDGAGACGSARHGMGLARHCKARHGKARLGAASQGWSRQGFHNGGSTRGWHHHPIEARQGVARPGSARRGQAGQGFHQARARGLAPARPGMAGVRLGAVRLGGAWPGEARQGFNQCDRRGGRSPVGPQGLAWRAQVWHGEARVPKPKGGHHSGLSPARHGRVRPGKARRGRGFIRRCGGLRVCAAWQATARRGKAWRGLFSPARHGRAWHGKAWLGPVRPG
jgi:hypothetical protein